LLAGLASILLLAACAPANAPTEEAEVPSPADIDANAPPNVTLATPKEIRAALDAERGNVVVMNFWATWCPPCVKEMPELAKFWREFDGHGVRFLSISADHHSLKDRTVVPFVKSYEIPFPVRVMYVDDPDGLLEALPLTWEDRPWDGALPATFIFDTEGNLAWSTVGEVNRDLLAEKIQPLLGESPD
jgi:peroxiredoxin